MESSPVPFPAGTVDDAVPALDTQDAWRSLEAIAESLRCRRDPGDFTFDRLLPPSLRVVSDQHWTPLAVALRAARWFEAEGIDTVVDIGSGAGKFCVAAALSGDCRFVGVEQRPRFVTAARRLARSFRLEDRVHFLHGAAGEDPLPLADAYYLFNPFGENLLACGERLDEDVELSDERFARDVETTERFLEQAPLGTYVMTYNGFGGRLPEGYAEVRVDRTLPNVLKLSRKAR